MKQYTQPLAVTRIDNMAYVLVLIGVFFLPFSRSLDNCIALGAVLTLFGGQLPQKWQLIRRQPLFWSTLLLLGVFALGLVHNTEGWHRGWYSLYKYGHKLLAMLVLFPLFTVPSRRRGVLNVLLCSTVLATVVWALQMLDVLDLADLFHRRQPDHVIAPLQLSVLAAVAWFVVVLRSLEASTYRWLAVVISIWLFCYMFYINQERTGMLLCLGLTALLLWQSWSWRGIALSLVLVPLLSVGIFVTSPMFSARFTTVLQESAQYNDASAAMQRSSIGLRLAFLKYSWQLIKARPLLGYGGGTFSAAYATTGGPLLDGEVVVPLGDPHNTYAHVAVEYGVVGLAVFIYWLFAAWHACGALPVAERRLAQGACVVFALACFPIAAFLLNQPCYLYVLMLAVLLPARSALTVTRG